MNKYLAFLFSLSIAAAAIAGVTLWQGVCSLAFAWVLNCMLMLSLLSFTQTFKLRLSSDYYLPAKWERNGKIYKWFGINIFRALLVKIGWEKLNKASHPVKKDPDALIHLEYSTRQSEFGHLVIFIIVMGVVFFVGFQYGFIHSLWLIVINVIVNVYPIGVQRYNRPRLRRVLGHASL